MELNDKNIGQIVKNQRLAFGLTQTKLAERAGCSQRFISELENGKAQGDFSKVLAILNALQLQVHAIPATSNNSTEEVSRVAAEALGGIRNNKKRPRLSDYLEAR